MINSNFVYPWDVPGIPTQIQFGETLSLDDIALVLADSEVGLPSLGIDFTFNRDQIESGGMFRKQYQDCLEVFSPNYPGYWRFLFTVNPMGGQTILNIDHTGVSENMRQIEKVESNRNSTSAIKSVIGMFQDTSAAEQALDKEIQYYQLVFNKIAQIFGVH